MIGTTISHYEILEEIGRGGMGVVYKARDTLLDRPVALKFLPLGMTSDQELTERFIREAKAGASSDHANICTIYEIGHHEDGQLFIAMAYYDGSTLRERLSDGPMTVEEAVRIARQIGLGLKAAHDTGVVHRDIKPGNIQITDAGDVKILDFGLAKLKGGIDLTKTGTSHGTPAYMSPEQLQAGEIDHRTDIWSLGAVLFEMLTGTKAFEGDYEQAISYGILHGSPDVTRRIGADVPLSIIGVMRKALEKDPSRRYQSIDEFLAELPDDSSAGSAPSTFRLGAASLAYTVRTRWRVVTAVSGLVAAGFVVAWLVATGGLGSGPAAAPAPIHTQVTFDGISWYPSISPDGEYVAYVQFEGDAFSGDPWTLKLHDLRGQASQTVFESDSGAWIRTGPWSPDGTRFLVRVMRDGWRKTDLLIVPRLGGQSRVIARRDADSNHRGFGSNAFGDGPCWSHDGNQIFSVDDRGFYIYDLGNGARTFNAVEDLPHWVMSQDCSPVDGRFLFVANNQNPPTEFIVTDPEQPAKEVIYSTTDIVGNATWSRDATAIYFVRGGGGAVDAALVRLDLGTDGLPIREPVEVLSPLAWGAGSLSSDNSRLAYARRHTNSEIVRVDVGSGERRHTRLSRSTLLELLIRISPDGESVMFLRRGDLFEMPIDGGQESQITNFGNVRTGTWSPDGSMVVATRSGTGTSPSVWVVNRDGTDPRQIDTGPFTTHPARITWDWTTGIVMNDEDGNLIAFDHDGSNARILFRGSVRATLMGPRPSPDGSTIALAGSQEGGSGLWLFSPADSSLRFVQRQTFPIDWSDDGKSLYVFGEGQRDVVLMDIASGETERIIDGSELAREVGMDVVYLEDTMISRHGDTFVIMVYEGLSDIWIIDNFDPSVTRRPL